MKCYSPISDLNIECYSFLPEIEDGRMYVIRCRDQALVIDPNRSEEAINLLHEIGDTSFNVLLTHEHYDHISGVEFLKTYFPNCRVICTVTCGRLIENSKTNLSRYWKAQYILMNKNLINEVSQSFDPFSCKADVTFSGIIRKNFCNHSIIMRESLGHSKGGMCILIDSQILFSGDNLVPHTKLVTTLPGGSKEEFIENTLPFLKTLSPDIWTLPGHYDGAKLGELMKEHNY